VPSHLYLSLACLNCRIILRAISLDIAVTPWRILKLNQGSTIYRRQSIADTNSTSDAAADDWASDSTDDDDWDFDEDADKPRWFSKDVSSTTYEVSSEPRAAPDLVRFTSTVIAEPKSSGVGKTESVYDADYRVLTPPHKETDTAGDEVGI